MDKNFLDIKPDILPQAEEEIFPPSLHMSK